MDHGKEEKRGQPSSLHERSASCPRSTGSIPQSPLILVHIIGYQVLAVGQEVIVATSSP